MDITTPVFARIVLRALEAEQVDSAAILAGSGVSREDVLTGSDLPLSAFLAILSNAEALAPHIPLGLLIGTHNTPAAMGELGATITVAPTLRSGLQALESFSRLEVSYVRMVLESRPSGLLLRLLLLAELGSAARYHLEASVMLLQHYYQLLVGEPLRDGRYDFGFPEPACAADYPQYYSCPWRFGCADTRIFLHPEALDSPSPYFNRALWDRAQLSLSRRLEELGRSQHDIYTNHVNAILGSASSPLPDLADVAQSLHMSVRTLNRRLQRENSTYRELKSAALRTRAQQYLRDSDLSVEAIAAILGYQDTANFRRAFRGWEGQSPNAYRRKIHKLQFAV